MTGQGKNRREPETHQPVTGRLVSPGLVLRHICADMGPAGADFGRQMPIRNAVAGRRA